MARVLALDEAGSTLVVVQGMAGNTRAQALAEVDNIPVRAQGVAGNTQAQALAEGKAGDMDTLVATPALDTLMDTEDMVLDTLVDTEDMVLDTLVDTDSVTEATPVVTTASARLRLSPRLMLMLRLIPTSDTDTA